MTIKQLERKLKSIKSEVESVLFKHVNNVRIIKTSEELQEYFEAAIANGIIAIDTETNNSLDPLNCEMMGLCVYTPGQKYAYIPINHKDHRTDKLLSWQLKYQDIKKELSRVKKANIKIIMHNGKFDYEVIKHTCGIEIVPTFDTMIGAKLLNENEPASLKKQYILHVDKDQEEGNIERLFNDIEYALVSPEVFGIYSATDPYMTYKLYEYQLGEFGKKENSRLYKLFNDIEMPMVEIVANMELVGAKVDENYCQKLKEKYENIKKSIDDQIGKKIEKLNDVIDRWKNSDDAQNREVIYATKKDKQKQNFEKVFCYISDINGERYKLGKKRIEQISDPINLSSPKQLMVFFYQTLKIRPCKTLNPLGTGKLELEVISRKMLPEAKKYLEKAIKLMPKDIYDADFVVTEELEEKIAEIESYYSKANKIIGNVIFDFGLNDFKEGLKRINVVIDICNLLLRRREVEKLITTYLNVVPKLSNHWSDGKIRFHLNSLGARTGRFSSGGAWKFLKDGQRVKLNGMNQQNIPSKNHEVRLMFEADNGHSFVSGDFGQQEPKLTAFLSMDPKMIKAFKDKLDIYAIIAQSIFDNRYEDNLEWYPKGTVLEIDGNRVVCGDKDTLNKEGKKRRSLGKTVILAIMYGMTKNGLATKLEDDSSGNKSKEDRAEEILDKVFSEFTVVKEATDNCIKQCKKYGYLEGLYGRRRRLPDITLPPYRVEFKDKRNVRESDIELLKIYKSKTKTELSDEDFEKLRLEALNNNVLIISNVEKIRKAERQCFNALIQGSAATMTKRTMILIHRDQILKDLEARLVFQIHDEVILDCPSKNAEKVKERLQLIMEHAADTLEITVPVYCDMTIQQRWGEQEIVSDVKADYQSMLDELSKEQAFKKLCEIYTNFPENSLKEIVTNQVEAIRF